MQESQGNGVSFHREKTTSSSQHNVLLATIHNGDKYYLLASSNQSVSFVDEAYKTAKEQNQQSNPQAWKELLFNIISVDESTVNTPFLLSSASNAVKATSPIALSKL